MSKINLDDHRDLFRDEAAFERFVTLFTQVAENSEISPIWRKDHHLANLMSPASFQALLSARMIQKLVEQPFLLDDLKKSLQDREVVGGVR